MSTTNDTPRVEAFWQNNEYQNLREDHKISAWSDFARDLERELSTLRARVADLEKIKKNECDDWAHDHTHLQNLCRDVGYDEKAVEGDKWGIRSITELGDMLRAKCSPPRTITEFCGLPPNAFAEHLASHNPDQLKP